jgi:acetyl esterase
MPLHPFIEKMLAQLAGRPALSAGSPADARDMVAAGRTVLGRGPDMHDVRELALPTRSGTIRGRLLTPSANPRGLVVYLHGGGWVVGSIDDFETLGRTLAAESGCAVLLPDYRLAPEHPFPAGLEDSEDVILHAARNIASAAGGTIPLIVAGDSAGANLATVAARRLRGKADIALQVLIYPVTDSDFATGSYQQHGEGLPLTTRDMAWFFNHYAPRTAWEHPEISPLRAGDLAGMPPAVIVTAEYDVLADEGQAYAETLRRSGVPVVARTIPGVTHGFIRLHNLFDIARDEVKTIAAEIAAACNQASAKH